MSCFSSSFLDTSCHSSAQTLQVIHTEGYSVSHTVSLIQQLSASFYSPPASPSRRVSVCSESSELADFLLTSPLMHSQNNVISSFVQFLSLNMITKWHTGFQNQTVCCMFCFFSIRNLEQEQPTNMHMNVVYASSTTKPSLPRTHSLESPTHFYTYVVFKHQVCISIFKLVKVNGNQISQ